MTVPYATPITRLEMRLYSGKIPAVGAEIVKGLVEAGDIEVTDRAEAEMDVQAVLKEYIRLDREITEKTKDVLQKRNLPYEQFGKVKRALAGERVPLSDDPEAGSTLARDGLLVLTGGGLFAPSA